MFNIGLAIVLLETMVALIYIWAKIIRRSK